MENTTPDNISLENINLDNIAQTTDQVQGISLMIREKILEYGPQVLLAIIVWFAGIKLISLAMKLLDKTLTRSKVEVSLKYFLENVVRIILKILLALSVLAMIGVETTSFLAALGAAGLAIGLALQGSLANFAGGVIILFFKPFRIGDVIRAQDSQGRVTAINIFVTKLITLENKTIYLPNGPLANDTILNFSQQDNIRVDVRVGIAYDADLLHAKSVLQTLLDDTDKLLHHPKPQVLVDELGDSSVNLILRGFVIPSDYREVYYNLMEHAKLTLDKHDIEIPFPQRVVHMKK